MRGRMKLIINWQHQATTFFITYIQQYCVICYLYTHKENSKSKKEENLLSFLFIVDFKKVFIVMVLSH